MNIIKVIDLKNTRIMFNEEDLIILRLTRDHVNANRDDNTDKTSSPPSFTSLNQLDNNYSERY